MVIYSKCGKNDHVNEFCLKIKYADTLLLNMTQEIDL